MKTLLMILCFSPILFITCQRNQKIIVNKNDNSLTERCINPILKNIYNSGDLILSTGNVIGLHYPTIIYDWKKPLTNFNFNRNNIALFFLDDKEDFGKLIRKMSKKQFFNPTAKFVVASNNISSELLAVSSKFYLSEIIFIETTTYSIYTYEPYQNQNSGFISKNFKPLTQCKNIVSKQFKLFGRHRPPKTWNNTTLKVIYNVIPPYFQCPTCKDGIESDLLNIISHKLDFEINYVENKDFRYWGNKVNGNYTYILQKLFYRKCDMVLGAFHSKYEEHLDFDTTFTFESDGLFWLVPSANKLSGYKKLILVLNFETYLTLLATMIVIPLICCLLYKNNFLYYFSVLYQTLFEVALPRMPRYKLVYFHIIIPFLILSTVFKGSLIHMLSIDHYEYQLRSLEDIVESNLSITFDHDIIQYFKTDNPLDKHVYQRYQYCEKPRECINRTAFERNVVTVDLLRTYEYHLANYYVDSNGKPLLYLFRTPIVPLYIHWYFVKGYPLFSQIDDILLRLKSTGIIHYLCDKATFKARVDLSRKVGIASNILGLKEMHSLFVLISLGHFLSIIVFFVELAVSKKKGRG